MIGTDVQAYDPDLAALAANSTTGFWAYTGAGTGAARTLTAPAAGLTISNGAGTAGNPTFALANDLAALEALSSTGFGVRTGSDTWAQRTITGTANEITCDVGHLWQPPDRPGSCAFRNSRWCWAVTGVGILDTGNGRPHRGRRAVPAQCPGGGTFLRDPLGHFL